MPTTISQLSSTGTLAISGAYDEVTLTGAVSRISTSTFQTSGALDEVFLQPGSIYFNGTSYLQTNTGTSLALGSGDFTVELNVLWSSGPGGNQYIMNVGPTWSSATGISILYYSSQIAVSVGNYAALSLGGITLNKWTHIAVVRVAGSVVVYKDGVVVNTPTANSSNLTDNYVLVGYGTTSFGTLTAAYISNVRIVKGTALYTSNFTPSAAPLLPVTNTSLLLNTPYNDAAFIDNSPNNFTVTKFGSPTSSALDPFTLNTVQRINTTIFQVLGYFDEYTNHV